MTPFTSLAYTSADEMMFGRAPRPVRCGNGLQIGAGQVFPEVNYTLPPMDVSAETLGPIVDQYSAMVSSVLSRLATLGAPGAVLEFEHLPPMTDQVDIGVAVTRKTVELIQEASQRNGCPLALRVTVCDTRDQERPPRMRTGAGTERVLAAFEANARAGADLLSIESTGGKEVSDRALVEADIPGLLLALGVLAPRDMHYLWSEICSIAAATQVIAAGDTACGFANTAMVLADQHYIPNVLAAVVRAMSAVRSLAAFEEGAVGPSKDCAYEGPVLKAITGCPISMEGKASACAHFSHMGNIAAAVCDLWSNESVQNVRLLSGNAPEVFSEILAYDCRLMNQALAGNRERTLQELLVDSDAHKSVHALIISPQSSFEIATAIIGETDDFHRTRQAGLTACRILRKTHDDGLLPLPQRELAYLDRIEEQLGRYTDEGTLLEACLPTYADVLLPQEYGL